MKKTLLLLLLATLFLVGCQEDVNNNETNTGSNEVTTVENEVNVTNNSTSIEDTATQDENTQENEPVLAAGETMPDFEFITLEGKTVKISDYKGQIIMLNFWATWCPYCVQEMPDLETMNTYDDVVVLALNAREDFDTVSEYISETPYDFDILLDEDGYYSDLFYVSSLPSTFFIDEDGILLGMMPGMMTLDQMETIIQDIRDDKL